MSDSNRSLFRLKEESVFGEQATGNYQDIRHTSNSLANPISTQTSNEIDATRQVTDLIKTSEDPAGAMGFDLSYGSLDNSADASIIEGTMFSDWGTTVAISATDLSAANADNSYNSVTTDFTAENLAVGQWIRVAGFTDSDNNGYAKVVSIAASKLVVSGLTLADEAAGDTVTMDGTMIRNGVVRHSFSIEKGLADAAQYQLFLGSLVNAFNLSVNASGVVEGSVDWLVKSASALSGSSVAGSVVAAPTNSIFSTVDHVPWVLEGGSGITMEEFSLSVANNLRGRKAVGQAGNYKVGEGRCVVTGSLTLDFVDATYYNKYINQTESSLAFALEDSAGNAYIFSFPRIKYTADPLDVGGIDGDVRDVLAWQALKDNTLGYTMQIDKIPA
jgi:hypothetical protein